MGVEPAEPSNKEALCDCIRRMGETPYMVFSSCSCWASPSDTNCGRHPGLSLFQNGWEPMNPVDSGLHVKEANKKGPQVTICFKMKEDFMESDMSLKPVEASCLCLETYGCNYLGFHNVSNTLLHEIVSCLQTDLAEVVVGVSMGVSSVISDYTVNMPPLLTKDYATRNEKYIQLAGQPWTSEDVELAQRIQMCLIACLMKEGYKVCMDVNMDTTS